MLIDFHTHIFPDKIAERTLKILSDNTYEVEGVRVLPNTDGTLDGIKKSMKEHGVDISLVLPIATNTHQSQSINSFAAQINGHEEIIYSFGSLHPMQEDWEQTLENIKELGLRGIKLHPEYQQFYINCPESIRILKKCEELGLCVYLHAGCDIGIRPPVHCSPEQLRDVLNHISGRNIIAAHMGGWRMWDDVEKYLVGTQIMLDTAYVISDIDKEQLIRIIRTHGSEKILFGTDSPWEKPSDTFRYINGLPLLQEEKDNIFFANAKRLLNI